MKRIFVALTLLSVAVNGYSQGQVVMADYLRSDFGITVWSPQLDDPAESLQGNGSVAFDQSMNAEGDNPSGTQDGYTGVPLGGYYNGPVSPTDYTNGTLVVGPLYAAPGVNQPISSLSPVGGTVGFFNTSTEVEYVGEWNEGTAATISMATTGGVSPNRADNCAV